MSDKYSTAAVKKLIPWLEMPPVSLISMFALLDLCHHHIAHNTKHKHIFVSFFLSYCCFIF